MFKKKLLLNYLAFYCLFTGLLGVNNLLAQENGAAQYLENDFWDSVRFGGSLGLSFGNKQFTGIIAPSAVYDFNEIVSAGVGLNAAYAKQGQSKATSLGGSVLALIRPLRFIQLSAEFQELNIHRKYELIGLDLEERYWVPALWAGIGYNTGNVVAGVRYDLLYDENKSFYSNAFMPFVSVYF
ncbi:alpha-ketoglutarate decarboxylase [Gillisia sp. Hel_I_86]|uniref:alpha-ketoglutarate decarboxylase n=1 Tax=Gillisia sp. Hel_I_86 TaxID=1249981 RepID=UPI00119D9A7B|nr:alpha-ketoglutarate decarboxylase [Gillisia sp. Hel_I_86]